MESDPITVKINPSVGDDLKVWNLIKSDVRLGIFMQLGAAAKLRRPDTEISLMKEIDEIVADHPDSYLAAILRVKVAACREKREKQRIERQRIDEKVKRFI